MKRINLKNKLIVKIGSSYGFLIPKALIDNNILDPKKLYDLEVKENVKDE